VNGKSYLGNYQEKNIMEERFFFLLAGFPLFSCFEPETLKRLLSSPHCYSQAYGKGQVIHIQDEQCLYLDCIIEGSASLQNIDEEGSIMKVNVLTGGEVYGAPLLFSSRNVFPLTVVADSPTSMVHIERSLVLSLCEADSRFTAGLLTLVSDRALFLTETIEAIKFKTIRRCLLDYLRYEYHRQKSLVIHLSTSKKELAQRLGVQRTSLSRELGNMRSEGLIQFDSRSITIQNKELIL
jgi:CRP-like cAMP-binding protein